MIEREKERVRERDRARERGREREQYILYPHGFQRKKGRITLNKR